MTNIIEKRLIEEFKNRDSFTRIELFDFFRSFEPDLKSETFGWRIHNLKNKDIIISLMRSLYSISNRQKYNPEISREIIKIAKKINGQFSDIKYCIWETGWLNEFSLHQASKRIIVVEIEKEFVETLYYELKDSLNFDIYLNPNEKVIDLYVSESSKPIVIKKLITRSPIAKRFEGKIKLYTPTPEKILVDLFADEKLFYFSQGSELTHIYENAVNSYVINFTKLFSYAKRRNKELSIKMFLNKNLPHIMEDVINDSK